MFPGKELKDYNSLAIVNMKTFIDHLKKTNSISYSLSGDDLDHFSMKDLIKNFSTTNFSQREIEILNYLAEGMTCKVLSNYKPLLLQNAPPG
jgi:DNA-binding NarL/FixJ family response regulator